VERAALQRGNPFGHELSPTIDQARVLGTVCERAARDLVVVGFVGDMTPSTPSSYRLHH
jgi:hypothetical protein